MARWQLIARMRRLRDGATLQIASMLAAAANSESPPSDDLQIVGAYRNGSPVPPAENLQAISKEIQGGLQVGFKPVTSSAAKH